MAVRKVEDELDRLSKLRDADPPAAMPALRKALGDRVNVIAAKAAKIASERQFRELIPDLLRAFDRLLENAVERDPQCWGKNAIATALKDLGHMESAPFLRGMRHIQMEPSFGRPVDTAETLRGTCLLALAACADLARDDALRCFVDALTEESHTIRLEAVRALAQMEGIEAALVLRLKARGGDEEPQVMGQVFDALLSIEGERAVPLVAEFLHKAEGAVREEAALALGSSRLPEASELLQKAYEGARDAQFREVLLRAVSLTRQERAIEWLLGLARTARKRDAIDAIHALALHRGSEEIRRNTASAVKGREPELEAEYRKAFEG
jgi:HEAT repeat protein